MSQSTYLYMESIISTVSSRILGHRYGNSLSTLLTVAINKFYVGGISLTQGLPDTLQPCSHLDNPYPWWTDHI